MIHGVENEENSRKYMGFGLIQWVLSGKMYRTIDIVEKDISNVIKGGYHGYA